MYEPRFSGASECFSILSDALLHCSEHMNWAAFDRAVDALAGAPRIACSGCGHSGIVCEDFAHLLCCIERPARYLSPAQATHGELGFLQAGDVMLLVSRGGQTEELIPILDICKKRDVTVITVTENLSSPLALGADIVLPMTVTRECDPYNSQGTTSTVVFMAIFIALQTALIEKTGFRLEHFALNHPGGAMGKRLNP